MKTDKILLSNQRQLLALILKMTTLARPRTLAVLLLASQAVLAAADSVPEVVVEPKPLVGPLLNPGKAVPVPRHCSEYRLTGSAR